MKRKFIFLFLIVFILSLCLIYYRSTNPSGIYYDGGMASGYGYWIIRDGRIYIKTRETNVFICTYSKTNGKWVASSDSEPKSFILQPSLLGITLETPTYDKYFPRRGFSWLFNETNSFRRHERSGS